MPSEEQYLSAIESRIKSEYSKHKDRDWEAILARKIYHEFVMKFNTCDEIFEIESKIDDNWFPDREIV